MLIFDFINSYSKLPSNFYTFVTPTKVSKPEIIKINHQLAKQLKIDTQSPDNNEMASVFSGNLLPDNAKPLAQAYAGHQFGHFNSRLGDGRAILLGDVVDQTNQFKDIQLKGSGPTAYSRNGDGRAAIGPVIREYILSEAMHALGIKTTRALAAVSTGEMVYRQTPKPGAIITRVASSHIRIGTFEFFRFHGSQSDIQQLADFVIQRHYPSALNSQNPYLQLLIKVIDAQAQLVANWMHIGFIHGVMNTDNMSICGETIDYGPCAFMNEFNPSTVFSSIDSGGRYAYNNQGRITLWNLSRFAECLLPLLDTDLNGAVAKAESCLDEYSKLFQNYWLKGMLAKIGIDEPQPGDKRLIDELLEQMTTHKIDFTVFFRELAFNLESDALCSEHRLRAWIDQWKTRLQNTSSDFTSIADTMNAINPVYIPRNHLVEAAIHQAEFNKDYQLMEQLIQVLSNPFTAQEGMESYAKAPEYPDPNYKTFCGT